MNNRQRFFDYLENKSLDRAPFMPDITTWYGGTRKRLGDPQPYAAGEYIPDSSPLHQKPSNLNGKMASWKFTHFYREFDWGLPVHMYKWFETQYTGGVEESVTIEGTKKITEFKTPKGDVRQIKQLANDGSWAATEHFVKDISDLEIIKSITESTVRTPFLKNLETFFQETEGFGVCDIPISRSPFGKLVHNLMGFDKTVFALFDHEEVILDFLQFQEQYDLEEVRLAAQMPARVVILSDHADENLISPAHYETYCIPYYQKACAILHQAGKFVSTHLDGNFKGFFPILHKTGFDLLDGCTPAPMFNYEVEELAALADRKLHCYCGIPSTLFVQNLPTQELVDFGLRIVKAFDKKVLTNVGDILPQTGDINQVIEVGKAVMAC